MQVCLGKYFLPEFSLTQVGTNNKTRGGLVRKLLFSVPCTPALISSKSLKLITCVFFVFTLLSTSNKGYASPAHFCCDIAMFISQASPEGSKIF